MTTSTPNFFGGFDLAADKLLAEGINNYIAVNGTLNGGGEATSGVVLPLGDTGDFQARDTGDFFGDEFSDIAFWNPITGRVDIWDINDATGAHTVVSLTDAAGNLAVVTGATGWQLLETNGFDPDADGRADLLWWNPTFGAVDWWDLNVDPANPGVYTPYTLASGVLSSTWSYEGIGDFDGDYISLGKGGLKGDDVLWVNETTGLVAWWQIGGGAGLTNVTSEPHDFILFPGGAPLTIPAGWDVAAVGDWNGDGRDDIVLRNGAALPGGEQNQLALWQVLDLEEKVGVLEQDIGTIPTAAEIWNFSHYQSTFGVVNDTLLINNPTNGNTYVFEPLIDLSGPGVDLIGDHPDEPEIRAATLLENDLGWNWYSEGHFGSLAQGSVNLAPIITSNGGGDTATIALAENTIAVTTVAAIDADGTTPTYSISGGADASKFTIGSSTGVLSFVTAPNFELPTDAGGNNVYDVSVQASDGLGGIDTQAIAATVTDVNDDITGGPLAVDENSAIGAIVGTLAGQDPANQTLAFTLTNNAGGRFAIDDAGQVTVANGVLLDFEQNASHAIGVRVTDTGGLFFDEVFTVAVNDLNPETAIGDAGDNTLFGGFADDTINGQGGDDVLLGGGGNDYMTSGGGNDKAFGEAGNDTVIGADGDDYLNGGADDDLIVGNEGADTLLGDSGNDYLDGGIGDDLVMGGTGDDTVLGGDGNDYVNGEGGDDLVFGGDGIDTLLGADGNDYLNGENGNDIVFGDAGNDTVIGGEGNDYLSAGAGDDNLVGGNGNDTLFAGAGSDYLQGDGGDDFFIFDGTFQTSIIIDFEPGTIAHHDVIQFNGGVFTDLADMMSHAVQSATNTVITDAGGHTLTLANVVKANLISDDFVFI